ncbi:uncharacterized protein mettl21ca isoform X2 [Denticeps clupeoides]|uniref:Protein-lysine methyltransferase METTL21C-like n=1 Tax=Denticeps clupeoides TaxID=299321 RepID=A0AAY4CJX7_9TELE|nr:uncharacterized protein LOC114764617 isoform X2 [Denticeps clupeoides]
MTETDADVTPVHLKAWKPHVSSRPGKEEYVFAGYEIIIRESLDSYGAVIWPAALALCSYLETNQQTVNLVDKAVLEIGAGTGLVSIVASLMGAWVTATDLPDILANLRCNLSRNTRGRCKYTPQVAPLSWGHDLEEAFPSTVYHYDYILAADVVYHHDYLNELLVSMRHFCRPGTSLIWANKVRFPSDLTFTESFRKSFHTTVLAEGEEVKIYMASAHEEVTETDRATQIEEAGEEEVGEELGEDEREGETNGEQSAREEAEMKGGMFHAQRNMATEHEVNVTEDLPDEGRESESKRENGTEDDNSDGDRVPDKTDEKTGQEEACKRSWEPTVYYRENKEMYYFAGEEIKICESLDSFGAMIWPAAVTLSGFLDSPAGRQQVQLLDKSALELGAGPGLLSIVAALLGAQVTATDLPDILGNLRCNLSRNTRGRCRHPPQVTSLFWGYDLEDSFPRSLHRYDYILASDVVYHHDYLKELLFTMKHFCQPGTSLIWANKFRFKTDLDFEESFKKSFHTKILAERDEVKIYMATAWGSEDEQITDQEEFGEEEEESNEQGSEHEFKSKADHNTEEEEFAIENKEDEEDDNEEEMEMEEEHEELQTTEGDGNESTKEDFESRSAWEPRQSPGRERYNFVGHEICIYESPDSYGAMIWPASIALSGYLESPEGRQQVDLLDKVTLELGAGTGLLSVVATLLGAQVTATDLPEILDNLRFNLSQNTRGHCQHPPRVEALFWGYELEKTFPRSQHHYNYILAADVVYHHDYLKELLFTMRHFCQPGTTLIWANKIHLETDVEFLQNFQETFHTTLLAERNEVKIYMATAKTDNVVFKSKD